MPDTEPQSPESCRKIAPIEASAIKEDQRLVSGFISTIDVDMIGDVVLPGGMDDETYFAGTRSVNLDHEESKAVGTNRNLATRPRGVWGVTYVGKHALGEDTLIMLKEGVIRGMSIEWNPRTLVASPPTREELGAYGPGCKRVFRRWTLTRYAFTACPMNPYALVDGIKSAKYITTLTPIWEAMESLFKAGKIHRASAVAAGFPDTPTRKLWAVSTPRKLTAMKGLVASGAA